MAATRKTSPARRRWWQHLVRGLVLVVLAAGAAYATLPWWVPEGLLARRLAEDLARQVGTAVRVEGVSLSWFDGVEVRGLVVDAPASLGGAAAAEFPSIRTELAPVDFLLRRRLDWLELTDPQVRIRPGGPGDGTLGVLRGLLVGITVDRLTARGGRVVLELPGTERPLAVRIAALQAERTDPWGLTLSGALEQPGGAGEAPVSLTPAGGPATGPAAALTFANIDLAALPVAELTGLPLTGLSGRCDGVLDLKPGRDALVDAFALGVRVRRLDVRTEGGRLPVIDDAHLRLRGRFDPVAGSFRLTAASARLPGLDVEAEVDAAAAVFGGHWEGIDSLRLHGQVRPGELAAVLTGRGELPGGVRADGPVGFLLAARREGRALALRAEADANGLRLRRGEVVVKPAGRVLAAGLTGRLDDRTSEFRVADSWLRLGGNRFTGHGALLSLRRFGRELRRRGDRPAGRVLLAELGRLNWSGKWEIADLPAMEAVARAFVPGRSLPEMRLAGAVTGRWFIHHGPEARLHAIFEASPQARLSAAGLFVKPPGKAVHLHLSAAVDPNDPRLADPTVELAVGQGRLSVTEARLAQGPDGALELAGRIHADRVEQLLACLPQAGRLGSVLEGDVTCAVELRHGAGDGRLRVLADLSDAAVLGGPWFRKPRGEAGRLGLNVRGESSAGGQRRALLACSWSGAAGDVEVNVNVPRLPPGGGIGRLLSGPFDFDVDWAAEVTVRDANRLVGSSQWLARRVGAGGLAGRARLTGRGSYRGGVFDADISCDAAGLALAASGAAGRAKPAGTTLSLRLDGALDTSGPSGRASLRLRGGELALGESRLAVGGTAELLVDGNDGEAPGWSVRLGRARLDANAVVTVEPALAAMVPELAGWVNRCGLSGRLRWAGTAECDGEALRLRGWADAGALRMAGLALPVGTDGNDGGRAGALGCIVKPADVPVEATWDISLRPGDPTVRLHDAALRVGDSSVRLVGSLRPAGLTGGGGELVGREGLRATISVPRAQRLGHILPGLEPLGLSGGLSAEVEFAPGRLDGVRRARVDFHDFSWRRAGRVLSLAGPVAVERLDWRPAGRAETAAASGPPDEAWARRVVAGLPRIGRVRTDGLKFRAGRSAGWLVADVASLPARARGSFHVLAGTLDLEELEALGSGGESAATRPARPRYKLTDEEVHALRRRGRRLGLLARRLLGQADLTGRMSIARARTYDVSVDRRYELKEVEVQFSARAGRVELDLAGGMNGGLLHDRHAVDLTAERPTVTTESVIDGLLPDENFQPQLAKFFPGNTVTGSFSRWQKTRAPLTDALAAGLDPRYPIHPVGRGRTEAVEGVTQGRAAPEFVAKIFPGLNLAKYRYRKMTAFAEFGADGTVKNDMVFRGELYDLYMEGTTDAENIGRYEVGLILLGAPQSAEFNHTYGQGRIPLLNMKARIEGGKMHDQEVRYLWPNETLFVIFLKNNIFYRLWLAANKNR